MITGFSGAQLFNLVNESALLAARYESDCITTHLLDEARDKILMGVPRCDPVVRGPHAVANGIVVVDGGDFYVIIQWEWGGEGWC